MLIPALALLSPLNIKLSILKLSALSPISHKFKTLKSKRQESQKKLEKEQLIMKKKWKRK
mgnify:CR=1 FL=1